MPQRVLAVGCAECRRPAWAPGTDQAHGPSESALEPPGSIADLRQQFVRCELRQQFVSCEEHTPHKSVAPSKERPEQPRLRKTLSLRRREPPYLSVPNKNDNTALWRTTLLSLRSSHSAPVQALLKNLSPLVLPANSPLVAHTSFLDWKPTPAAAGGVAQVSLVIWQMFKSFGAPLSGSKLPADIAFWGCAMVLWYLC